MLRLVQESTPPTAEEVVDRLCDILFATDEVLDLVRERSAPPLDRVQRSMQRVYEEINDLMKQLAD